MERIAYLLVLFLLIGIGVGGTIAGGCQQTSPRTNTPQLSPTPITKTPVSQQLIIKFKTNTIECNPAGIAQLSSTTHVSLEFVRAMSGDACVVKQTSDSTDNLLHGQKRLKDNRAVEYLEPDAVMKAL